MKVLTIGGYKFEAVFTNGKLVTIVARTWGMAMDYAKELATEQSTTLHSLMNVF